MAARSESIVYGVRAALAVARHRPDAILRVFHHIDLRRIVAPLLKAAAAARRPYREVQAEELERLAQSKHHEGVVVVTRPLPCVAFDALLAGARPTDLFLALDEVGNPHNLGAILRSAAYFGCAGVLFPATDRQAELSAAAVRVAQGGAEVVPCCAVADLAVALRALTARGLVCVAADTRGGTPAARFAWPPGLCLVMGNEGQGLRSEVRAACKERVTIGDAAHGEVESLNVSVAAGVLLAFAAGRAQPA